MIYPKEVCVLVLLLAINLSATKAQKQLVIEGEIRDASTKDPLPYASVGVLNQHLGTVSNSEGFFRLYLPDSLLRDSIQINYLGYHSYKASVYQLQGQKTTFGLKPALTPIEAVTIRPLSPEEIIKRVIENLEINYPQEPFISKGFYLQELVENEKYIQYVEAFIDVYTPPFQDTSKCQARLIQGRSRDDLGEIQFMKRFAEKKIDKEQKKASRKGKELDSLNAQGIQVSFSEPNDLTSIDNIRQFQKYYHQGYLRKFKLTLEKNTSIGGHETYVVRCISKKPIDHVNADIKLYIDKASYALVMYNSDLVPEIPVILKPVFKLYRLSVENLRFYEETEYRLVNDKWYPAKTIVKAEGEATKKYSGNYTEHSEGYIRKAFVVTDVETKDIKPFSKEECITHEPFEKQLGEYNPAFWQNRNKIEY